MFSSKNESRADLRQHCNGSEEVGGRFASVEGTPCECFDGQFDGQRECLDELRDASVRIRGETVLVSLAQPEPHFNPYQAPALPEEDTSQSDTAAHYDPAYYRAVRRILTFAGALGSMILCAEVIGSGISLPGALITFFPVLGGAPIFEAACCMCALVAVITFIPLHNAADELRERKLNRVNAEVDTDTL